MKVSTKLQLGFIAISALFTLFIVTVFFLIFEFRQSFKKIELAERITEISFQSALLRGEYSLNQSESSKQQLENNSKAIQVLLDEAATLFKESEEHALLEDMRKVSLEVRELRNKLFQNLESGGRLALSKDLNDQINLKVQERVYSVLQLSVLSRLEADRYLTMLGFIVSILGIFIFFISLWSYLLSRSLANSLRRLSEDFTQVAALNFNNNNNGKDEFGMLSRAFNVMVGKLKESYENLEQKVQDRTLELTEKTVILEKTNRLMVDRELKMIELKKDILKLEKL